VIAERIVAADLAGSSPEPTLAALAGLAREVLEATPEQARLAGAQLALPGLVDAAHGVLLRAPNLRWRGVVPGPVLAREDALADVDVHVGNEADFAAVTVARVGPGRPSALSDFLYVSGEVGIGSSLVNRGEVMTGRHGWAGEIGHVCVDPGGPPCACGARGCLEAFAGQHALTSAAGVQDPEALTAALASGEPRAKAAAEQAASALGIALSGALNLLDVSQVVLGGHLGVLAEHLVPGIRRELDVRVLSSPFEAPSVSTVSLDAAPAALGAAYVALDGVLADPAAHLDDVEVAAD
jgi:predicted NBD/HSP70 family sugar kinase